jgi:hypothetical protein
MHHRHPLSEEASLVAATFLLVAVVLFVPVCGTPPRRQKLGVLFALISSSQHDTTRTQASSCTAAGCRTDSTCSTR